MKKRQENGYDVQEAPAETPQWVGKEGGGGCI